LIAGRVGSERLAVTAGGVEDITKQTLSARAIGRSRARVGKQPSKKILRSLGCAVGELCRCQAEQRIRKTRDAHEQLLGPAASLSVLAAMRGDRGERAHCRQVLGIELERAQVAGAGKSQRAKRDQRIALVGMGKAEIGMLSEQLVDVLQGFSGAIETLQAQ